MLRNDTRTITVKGVGKASASPDIIILHFDLSLIRTEYSEAVRCSTESCNAIAEAMASCALDSSDLKTVSYNISTNYEFDHEKKKNIFKGYRAIQQLYIEMPLDMQLLGRVMAAVSALSEPPQMSIDFSVKDKDALKDAMLADAARNARHKAEVLAAASGVKLGELLGIDYDWTEVSFISHTRCAMPEMMACAATADGAAPKINPDDINLSDTVTFVWEIE